MNKFKQVSSLDHHMSKAKGKAGGRAEWSLYIWVGWGVLYGEVQGIMGNGHKGAVPMNAQADRQTRLKTLPSRNFVGGDNKD